MWMNIKRFLLTSIRFFTLLFKLINFLHNSWQYNQCLIKRLFKIVSLKCSRYLEIHYYIGKCVNKIYKRWQQINVKYKY